MQQVLNIQDTTQKAIELHLKIEASAKKTIETAIELGGLLTATKNQIGHGNFTNWLKNLPFSERTARRYISIYANRKTVSELPGLNKAYKALATKTDTVSVLESAMKNLLERAFNFHTSQDAIIGLCWKDKHKYHFTKYLDSNLKNLEQISEYEKENILKEIQNTPPHEKHNTPHNRWTWVDAFVWGIEVKARDLEIPFSQAYKEARENMIKSNASKSEIEDYDRMCTEIVSFGISIGELAYNYITDKQAKALSTDIENLSLVIKHIQSTLGSTAEV